MQDDIKETLRKVLALTTSPVEGEAMAAAAMLQKLLTAHNLDIADLELKGHKKTPGVKEDQHDLGKAAFKWKLRLADVIAEHYFCVSLTDHYKKEVKFAGRPDNVTALKGLYVWIIEQIARIAKEDRRKHYEETGEHIDPLRWQVNFGLGAVGRLQVRLEEAARKRAENVTETGLVVHHLAEVSDYLEQKYGYRRDGRNTDEQRKRKIAWEQREKEMEELKASDPEEYYKIRPWERPLSPEEQKKQEKENQRYWARAARRTGPAYRPRSEAQIQREEQEQSAKAAGRTGAERVNLEPFLEGGKKRGEMR